jgi:hypothetical protein
MKKRWLLLFSVFVFFSCKSTKETASSSIIMDKNGPVASEYSFVVTKVITDSRCPVGTTCIWAGELIVELNVIQNNQIKETKTITFFPNQKEENLAWFQKYFPNQKLQKISISPSKTEKPILLNDYKITLVVE